MTLPGTMRAAILYDIDDVRVEERPMPEVQAGEMLVRTQASGICSGDAMAWYVKRKAPLVLGHEPAGEIVALGEGEPPCDDAGVAFEHGDRVAVHHHAPCFACAMCARGDHVQCATWRATRIDPGGIAEYFRVPRENARDTLRLPDHLSAIDGSLVEPLGCVMKSLRRSGVRSGELLYVIGLGVMGQLHVLAARAMDVRVVASDFLAVRRERAQANGALTFHPDDALAAVRAASDGLGADVSICGPGTPDALTHAAQATRAGGALVMFTPFEPGTPLGLDANDLYFRDLHIVASYSCGPNDTRAALALLSAGFVSAQRVGAVTYPLTDVARAYADIRHAKVIKPIITFA